MALITEWNIEDKDFWQRKGKKIAYRNLWISIPALLLAFSTWFIWSAVAVNLNNIGFNFSTSQLFTLAALPGLTGATLRIFYSFVVPVFGGRNWTIISTATLLIPSIGLGIAVQDPNTSFITMAILAALTGFGGGNFASSMSNISFFFPKKLQGTALGLNAGLGNLGVSVAQFVIPLVTSVGIFGALGGAPQIWTKGDVTKEVWIQNAAFVWVIPIILTLIAAFFGMNNLRTAKASVSEQLVIFKRKHMYLMTILYVMSFGSFIGFSAAFPLLIKTQFPEVNPLQFAFLGPLVGALIRPVGGWISDKLGGAIVTFWDIIVMIIGTFGVIYYINPDTKSFTGFFLMFMVLFAASGIANGSTFRMIPIIFESKEAAAVLGFTSAIAAYGAFFIPKMFGWSIDNFGVIDVALYILIAYYFISLIVTWYYYARKNAEIKC
ncbi:NarK family nitrate/nitrite MFS transporter [Microaerobacter geothermalis]|uniref:NarK family nitrate/nitrite MFS transporter n=1 Tax=Microaerobacter geothermalis TaxID=674972 RepID=UPI001F18438A|nr:NarK family nitrate/nitrite MFS transporter [Microaerobacter geothermalis]MCF6092567.1 NarK family nitrate/nitrite MFS transporter [Microaerobacter geothermalis]